MRKKKFTRVETFKKRPMYFHLLMKYNYVCNKYNALIGLNLLEGEDENELATNSKKYHKYFLSLRHKIYNHVQNQQNIHLFMDTFLPFFPCVCSAQT